MIFSFNKLLKEGLLIDYWDLEPFIDKKRALRWINSFNIILRKVGKQKTYLITEKELYKMNKEAYKKFCSRLKIMEKSKKVYEAKRQS